MLHLRSASLEEPPRPAGDRRRPAATGAIRPGPQSGTPASGGSPVGRKTFGKRSKENSKGLIKALENSINKNSKPRKTL